MSENIDVKIGKEDKNSPDARETVAEPHARQEEAAIADIKESLGVLAKKPEKTTSDARDGAILEANSQDLSSDWQTRITAGGVDHYNEKGEIVGRVFIGNQVGKGALGMVNESYFARHGTDKLEKGVAKTSLHENPAAEKAFQYERNNAVTIQSLLVAKPDEPGAKNLAHPLFIAKDTIVYEHIANESGESKTLHELMTQISAQEWLKSFAGAVEGLAFLQRQGIHHFDFKPANIVVGKNGEGTLIDYGAVRKHGEVDLEHVSITPKYSRGTNVAFQELYGVRDLCDKFSVAMSLREFLLSKGFVLRGDVDESQKPSYTIRPMREPASEAMKKLYDLYQKLSQVEYNYKPDMPEYVDLNTLGQRLRTIAQEFPEIKGAVGFRRENEPPPPSTVKAEKV